MTQCARMCDVVQVEKLLLAGLEICRFWSVVAEDLVDKFWVTNGEHPWLGAAPKLLRLSRLETRLEEVLSLRLVHEELRRLLTAEEQRELRVEKTFMCFSPLQALHVSPYTDLAWKAAHVEYERVMEPIERRLAEKLRSQLASLLLPSLQSAIRSDDPTTDSQLRAQPHQVLHEFSRFKELIRRPKIAAELVSERDKVIGLLLSYLKRIREDFEGSMHGVKSSSNLPDKGGRNLPAIVTSLVWTTQIISKVDQTVSTAVALLGDLARVEQLRTTSAELLHDLQDWKNSSFNDWCTETSDLLGSGSEVALETTGRLMDIEKKDGKVTVHYSERLVTLLREVRQLGALGFKIPEKIDAVANEAKRYYRYGVVLKQVANFYNTIDTQIIECQRSMLLEEALAFEKAIKSQEARVGSKQITWKDTRQLETYIATLKEAADRLTEKNRKLRKTHLFIADRIILLMNTDLVRQRDRWKEGVREIKSTIDQLQDTHKFKTTTWKDHWDHQLFKALEYQYKMGLESCHESLTKMEVKLVFKQRRLQFEPPLEEIRTNYYNEAKKFIAIPFNFKGVGETAIFKKIVDRNQDGLSTVYQQAESLFSRLQQPLDDYKDWVVLGSVDIEEFVAQHVTHSADFEHNFKLIKAKGRELEKLPNSYKCDCITVNALPVKSTIEDQLRHLQDALVNQLRKSCQKELEELEEFINGGKSKLGAVMESESIDAIANAREGHRDVMDRNVEMREKKRLIEEKSRQLRQICGVGFELNAVQNSWDELMHQLDAHETMIEEQKDRLKGQLDKRVDDYAADLAKFADKWAALKPKNVALDDKGAAQQVVKNVREWQAQLKVLVVISKPFCCIRRLFWPMHAPPHCPWQELITGADTITRECEQFDRPRPNFKQINDLETDLNNTIQTFAHHHSRTRTRISEKN